MCRSRLGGFVLRRILVLAALTAVALPLPAPSAAAVTITTVCADQRSSPEPNNDAWFYVGLSAVNGQPAKPWEIRDACGVDDGAYVNVTIYTPVYMHDPAVVNSVDSVVLYEFWFNDMWPVEVCQGPDGIVVFDMEHGAFLPSSWATLDPVGQRVKLSIPFGAGSGLVATDANNDFFVETRQGPCWPVSGAWGAIPLIGDPNDRAPDSSTTFGWPPGATYMTMPRPS